MTDGKTLVSKWFLEAMNSGDETIARRMSDDIFAANFIDHDGLDRATSSRTDWQEAVISTIFAAFSDIEVTIERLLAEADLVAVRYVLRATHTGTFRGISPTGRVVRHAENEIYRVADQRIVESWGEGSWLSTLAQLGVTMSVPASGCDGATDV